MKIVLIGPVYPYRGGIAHFNASLAQALEKANHQAIIISFNQQYPAWLYPGESDKDPSNTPLQYPALFYLAPLNPWSWIQTARYIQGAKPQLVLIHWWTTFWAPAYATLAKLLQRKFKITFLIHNVIPHEPKFWDRWLAQTALQQGGSFIVQAPHEKDKLENLLSRPKQIFYSPHPVYAPFQKQGIAKQEARERLGLPQQTDILLFFGIVRPYKGLKFLLEALSHVHNPVHLVIAGEFWDDIHAYQELIKNLGIGEHVTIINRYIPNEEAHLIFSAADGLVAPYVGGTQSGAVGLALGYGLPTILTEQLAAGLPESQKNNPVNNKYGYTKTVPPGNPHALAVAIDDLITILPDLHITPHNVPDDWGRLVKIIESICS